MIRKHAALPQGKSNPDILAILVHSEAFQPIGLPGAKRTTRTLALDLANTAIVTDKEHTEAKCVQGAKSDCHVSINFLAHAYHYDSSFKLNPFKLNESTKANRIIHYHLTAAGLGSHVRTNTSLLVSARATVVPP